MAKTLSSCFLQEPACTTHLHHSNRPSSTSCGSHKRLSSENPAPLSEPKPKKPNNGTHPHFLRRRRYIPTLPPVMEEPPLSPQPIECHPKTSPADNFSSSSDSPHREDNCGDEYVETVSVGKKGEALILHFKCPCGNGYQIILFGGNCYYKLM